VSCLRLFSDCCFVHYELLRGWGPSSAIPQVSPGAIQIQPFQGCASHSHLLNTRFWKLWQ